MKNALVFILFLSMHNILAAQDASGHLYFYRSDWTQAKNMDRAVYFMHEIKENDTVYTCRYYQKYGPMVKLVTYKDDQLTILNGLLIWYNKNGTIDSSGTVYQGQKDGEWNFYLGSLKPMIIKIYDKGILLKTTDYVQQQIVNRDGSIIDLKAPQKKALTDTANEKVYTVIQTPAQFEGGINAWQKFIQNTMKTPDRFINLAGKHAVKAFVGAHFDIDTDGKLGNIIITKSCEWSVDMEVIRMLNLSPKWKPAEQNFKKVIYRHAQQFGFIVE